MTGAEFPATTSVCVCVALVKPVAAARECDGVGSGLGDGAGDRAVGGVEVQAGGKVCGGERDLGASGGERLGEEQIVFVRGSGRGDGVARVGEGQSG